MHLNNHYYYVYLLRSDFYYNYADADTEREKWAVEGHYHIKHFRLTQDKTNQKELMEDFYRKHARKNKVLSNQMNLWALI
jgi:hypothetical protein